MRNGLIAIALACAACSSSGSGTEVPDDGPLPAWRVVLEDLDGAVLAFWGTTFDSLFAVGGTLGCDGGRALVLFHDGATWWDMPVDAPTL